MKHFLLLSAGVIAASALSGCVDDKYDLSDIDTTVKVEVKDLTIPVNIEPFTMETIFDIDEDDPDATIEVLDGVYAIVRSGSFSSDEIKFQPIHLSSSVSASSTTQINTGLSGNVPGGIDIALPFTTEEVKVSYSSSTVPYEVADITRLGANFVINYTLSFNELIGHISRLSVQDVVIDFPKGLSGTMNIGTYNAEAGQVRISHADLNSPVLKLSFSCTALDFAKIGGIFNAASHTADINTQIQITSGKLCFNSSDYEGDIPSVISINAEGGLTDIDVTTFSGRVNYNIDGVNINPVALDDLPDVLRQKDTRITLTNPQIYLHLENPLSPYKLTAQTGLTIKSVFTDDNGAVTETTSHSLDNPGYFEISNAAQSNYCLSPLGATNVPDGYSPCVAVPFTSLTTVLDGAGLPTSLDITLNDPKVDNKPVENLPIGSNLGIVEGKYEFVAPLSFGEGSQIVYTETETGWSSDDLDAITISTLSVTTTVTSALPFSVDFTGYPIDAEGMRINNVSIEGAEIPANCTNHEITIRITGEIRRLDGIEFTAKGFVPESMSAPLDPTMSISCKNIHATVSGYYEKEL